MAEVAAKRTPYSALEALGALTIAAGQVFGRQLWQGELEIYWIQSAHETAGWNSVPNNNPAGIKAGPNYAGPWRWAETWEGQGADEHTAVLKFRAYASLQEGMVDWLDIIKRGYPLAVRGALAGDLNAFVFGLLEGWGRSADYFTGDPKKYLEASKHWLALLGSLPIAWANLCGPDPLLSERTAPNE